MFEDAGAFPIGQHESATRIMERAASSRQQDLHRARDRQGDGDPGRDSQDLDAVDPLLAPRAEPQTPQIREEKTALQEGRVTEDDNNVVERRILVSAAIHPVQEAEIDRVEIRQADSPGKGRKSPGLSVCVFASSVTNR